MAWVKSTLSGGSVGTLAVHRAQNSTGALKGLLRTGKNPGAVHHSDGQHSTLSRGKTSEAPGPEEAGRGRTCGVGSLRGCGSITSQ